MTQPPRITRTPTWEDLDKRFEPYALQLGWLAYSWNSLHDKLGRLFWVLTGIKDGRIPLAIWNAVQNDRTQREMVRALAETVLADRKREWEDISWMLGKAQELEDRRNDALHSPLTFIVDPDGTTLSSNWPSGNRRAMKLKDKDLLKEFEWYGLTANVLAKYAWRVSYSLRAPEQMPWPDKPELPRLERSPNRKGQRPQTGAKSPPRPPESSEA
jgi:hypothetical protein